MKKTNRNTAVFIISVSLLVAGCIKPDRAPAYAHAYRLNEANAQPSSDTHEEAGHPEHPEAGTSPKQVFAGNVLSDLTLPKKLENVDTLTLLAVVRITKSTGEKREFIRDITRAKDRVHVAYRHQGQEWLFTRNPLDHRRATGELADHRNETVFTFFETDLMDAGVGRGWLDVMTLGVPYDVLQSMTKTGETAQRNGLRFEKYIPDDTAEYDISVPAEVWWNENHFLPLKIVRETTNGRWVQELAKIERGGNAVFLSPLSVRYTDYDAMDMTDWADSEAVENGTAVVSDHIDSHQHHH